MADIDELAAFLAKGAELGLGLPDAMTTAAACATKMATAATTTMRNQVDMVLKTAERAQPPQWLSLPEAELNASREAARKAWSAWFGEGFYAAFDNVVMPLPSIAMLEALRARLLRDSNEAATEVSFFITLFESLGIGADALVPNRNFDLARTTKAQTDKLEAEKVKLLGQIDRLQADNLAMRAQVDKLEADKVKLQAQLEADKSQPQPQVSQELDLATIQARVSVVGDHIRKLKAQKCDREEIAAAVRWLLELKEAHCIRSNAAAQEVRARAGQSVRGGHESDEE